MLEASTTKRRLKNSLFLGAGCLVFSALAWIGVSWDAEILKYLDVEGLPGDLRKAVGLSEAFAHGIGAAVILLAVYCSCELSSRPKVVAAILLTVVSGVAANGAKSLFVRIRPHSVGKVVVQTEDSETQNLGEKEDTIQVVEASFWDSRQRSFPSGHSAIAWGLAIGLAYAFPRGRYIFGMLAISACVQRLISGAHFPSDVLAGSAIAFFCSAWLILLPNVGDRLLAGRELQTGADEGVE